MSRPFRIAVFVSFILLCAPIYGQTPGALDPTFGNNGEFLFQPALPNGGTPIHRNSVLQADGKIVTLLQFGGGGIPNILARLNPDGTLDASFGSGGYVYMSWAGIGNGLAFAMTKQVVSGEERFVAAGWARCGRNSCLRAERYTSTGALDTTFGSGGVATSSSATTATAIAIAPADQKILLISGSSAVRLTADGFADPTFGSNGVSSAAGMGLLGIAGTSSGRVLVCGKYTKGKAADFAVARLNTNGSLDDGGRDDSTPSDSFGTGGRALTDFGGFVEEAYSVKVDAAGRIVASGQGQMGGSTIPHFNAVVVRYLANGQIDTSFGTGGKAWLDIGGRQDLFKSIAFQADGKIVLAGEGRFAGVSDADFLVARYNSDGSIDTSFGNGGWVMKDMYGRYDQVQSVLVQPDTACAGCEKIVIVGGGGTPSSSSQAVALRYFS